MKTSEKRNKKLKNEWIAELEEMQESSQGNISPADLPFDLTSELGEIVVAELKSPGVYYIGAKKKGEIPHYPEVYVVTADAPAISEKAWAYGQEFPGHPDLRVYDILQPGSGRHIIDFEMLWYQKKYHLPGIENEDSLYVAAVYGAEEHPDYFGAFPVPLLTPRGYTVRHRTILNGVYWLETDRCEEMLAVCYPIWQAEITMPEQKQGEQLEYDRIQGIDNTLGYLFFPKQSSMIPLYELSSLHPEVGKSGIIDMTALRNAICEFYPEYTAIHNEEVSKSKHGDFIKETPGVGTGFFTF